MDTHLEVVVIPVSGVDRAKAFYSMLGWRLDADVSGDEYSATTRRRPDLAGHSRTATKATPGRICAGQRSFLLVVAGVGFEPT